MSNTERAAELRKLAIYVRRRAALLTAEVIHEHGGDFSKWPKADRKRIADLNAEAVRYDDEAARFEKRS